MSFDATTNFFTTLKSDIQTTWNSRVTNGSKASMTDMEKSLVKKVAGVVLGVFAAITALFAIKTLLVVAATGVLAHDLIKIGTTTGEGAERHKGTFLKPLWDAIFKGPSAASDNEAYVNASQF